MQKIYIIIRRTVYNYLFPLTSEIKGNAVPIITAPCMWENDLWKHYHLGFHLGLKVWGEVCARRNIFVDHTLYYMLVHNSKSSYILHITDSNNVIIYTNILGGSFTPAPPLDETLPSKEGWPAAVLRVVPVRMKNLMFPQECKRHKCSCSITALTITVHNN